MRPSTPYEVPPTLTNDIEAATERLPAGGAEFSSTLTAGST